LARAAENFLNMEEYFDRGQFLEAEAIIDYVLRDLSAASRLLNITHQKRNKYQKSLEQLDSFVFPAWKDLSIVEDEFLQKTLQQISELRNQAISHSQSGELDQAVDLVEKAHNLKVTLIEKLKHESTVVYDLKFDSVNDEYKYLNTRTYHYLELVDLALAKKDIDLQTRNLVDNYIQQSMVNLESAENLESEGKFSDANAVLDKSIKQLTSVLKLLGVKI
jgi:tetratricopeptide (TPR) repeat protein